MKPLLQSLLICLGLALAPAVWADHEGHRHGQEAPGKLDDLSAAAMPSCCPDEGKPDGRAGGPPPMAMAAADKPRAEAGEPCPRPERGPGADAAVERKPCAGEGCKDHACKHGPDCPCMKGAVKDCDRHGDCKHKACQHGGGRHGDADPSNADDLRARVHQLERRLDMMQSVLENLLERPQGGRHMGGQH